MDYFENLKQKAHEGDAESQYVYACHLSNWNRSQEALAYFKMARTKHIRRRKRKLHG